MDNPLVFGQNKCMGTLLCPSRTCLTIQIGVGKNRLPYLVNSTIALTSPLTERETMKPSSI